jgi:hypothetical protein
MAKSINPTKQLASNSVKTEGKVNMEELIGKMKKPKKKTGKVNK